MSTRTSTKPTPTPWGPHVRGGNGLATVTTGLVEEVAARMAETADLRTVMVVTGWTGAGKSFSVGRAAETLERAGIQIVWADLSRSTSEKDLLSDLYKQIVGLEPDRADRARHLRDTLHEELATTQRVIVVDEAQHASKPALLTLRWFIDRSNANFALVLVGLPDLWKKLAPEVKSRCMRHVRAEGITDADLASVLQGLDPFLATGDQAKLRRLNATHSHGSFRWWAQFGIQAQIYAEILGVDTLTDELIEAVVEAIKR